MSLNSQITDLTLERGRAQGQGAAASGQAWGSALSNIGQQIGQTVASLPKMQEQAARTAEEQRARDARNALSEAMKPDNVGPVEQDGLKLYNVQGMGDFMAKKGYGAEFVPAAQHLDAVNQSMIGFQQARLNVVKAGAAGLLAADAPAPLVDDFLNRLEANQVYAPSTIQTYREHLKENPESAKQILRSIAGPAKATVLHEGDKGFDESGAPIPGMEVAPKPQLPTEASLALSAAGGDPGAAVQTLQAPAMAARETAAATQAETARHNAEMEKIGRMTAGREAAAQAETARHNKATEAAANPLAALTGAQGQPVSAEPPKMSGDEFLAKLPPQVASEVKAYAEGRRPFPSGMALKSPYFQSMIQMVGQYDPSFDASNYNARNKARLDLTSPGGTGGKSIGALNTAIQHAGKLSELIEKLDNYEMPLANAVVNPLRTATGKTEVTNFKVVAPQLMKEIERVWRGAGGTAGEIHDLIESISANGGRQQQREALAAFVDLAKGKLDSLEQQRDNVMGKAAGASIPILFDSNKPIMETIAKRGDPKSVAVPDATGPKVGETRTYQGETRTWNGTEWVKK